jgi:hypothetical protein
MDLRFVGPPTLVEVICSVGKAKQVEDPGRGAFPRLEGLSEVVNSSPHEIACEVVVQGHEFPELLCFAHTGGIVGLDAIGVAARRNRSNAPLTMRSTNSRASRLLIRLKKVIAPTSITNKRRAAERPLNRRTGKKWRGQDSNLRPRGFERIWGSPKTPENQTWFIFLQSISVTATCCNRVQYFSKNIGRIMCGDSDHRLFTGGVIRGTQLHSATCRPYAKIPPFLSQARTSFLLT